MNTLNAQERDLVSDMAASSTAETTPIRVCIVFRNPEQVEIFEKLLKRITKHDLKAMLIPESEINALLTSLGSVRMSIKQLRIGANTASRSDD